VAREPRRVRERLGQLQDGRVLVQRLGEVDDAHVARAERGGERLQDGSGGGHRGSPRGLWSGGAEGLLEPFRDDVGVHLGVDEQRALAALEPVGDGLEVLRACGR
jgi:hypothetical protein